MFRSPLEPRILIPFAIEVASGRFVGAGSVSSGAKCGCVCPGCKRSVIAKHHPSGIRQDHFAHHPSDQCVSGETFLHETAKHWLATKRKIWIPARGSKPAHLSTFEAGAVEQPYGEFVADTILTKEGHQLIVEIVVTNGLNQRKVQYIHRERLAALRVDLTEFPRDFQLCDLGRALTTPKGLISWVYMAGNPVHQTAPLHSTPPATPPPPQPHTPFVDPDFGPTLLHPVTRKKVKGNSYESFLVIGCPKRMRVYRIRNEPYAFVETDCRYCISRDPNYRIYYKDPKYVACRAGPLVSQT